MRPLNLPRLEVPIVQEICKPERLGYIEFPILDGKPITAYHYGKAHAFIGYVENAQVIGAGSLVTDKGIMVHGLSTGNYSGNIIFQLDKYEETPTGNFLPGEYVLIWGGSNFGHWVITYLMRATLLWYRSGLRTLPLLISDDTPKRFVEWLRRMGFTNFTFGHDGDRVEKLWVPSVVCYRGQYEDMTPHIFPEALHLLRRLILKDLIFPHPVRTKLYISRERSKVRRVDNEKEVLEHLLKKGFKKVFMNELTLENQLDLISRAEKIVIAAGGDSPITLFAPLDCEILELGPPSFAATFGSRCWAHILGQKFTRIVGVATRQSGPLPADFDYMVPLEKL